MSLMIPIIVGIVFFSAMFLFLGPKLLDKEGNLRTKQAIKTFSESKAVAVVGDYNVMKAPASSETSLAAIIVSKIPYLSEVPSLVNKSGASIGGLGGFFTVVFVILGLGSMITIALGLGSIGFGLTVFLALYVPKKYVRWRVDKRTEVFLESFPDALDMIVRSVRSGHPLNTALKIIAENMAPPISTEFKQVVDEISYGRSVSEALFKLSERIDQTDISFFVVVLAVQQETGGNLAEVLSNLSNIIRKRKQLRLKIKALTSEARLTAWVLGSLPGLLLVVLSVMSPGYLDPLFKTEKGKNLLMVAMSMVGGAIMLIRRLMRIDI